MKTSVVPIKASGLGSLTTSNLSEDYLDELMVQLDPESADARNLQDLAHRLRYTDVPIAFPTETVYGLGADATRSDAVRGIYTAKQRPSDNPLIVHFASLKQLRRVLRGHSDGTQSSVDPIPKIYEPLIRSFWPGPLTILLPVADKSVLAPEVTAGLPTFGARIPQHPIALALIQLADRPVAAPSANASTKPSPTAAEHVAHDLNGRIETIIDGGPCEVGVESTVVDGLTDPPLVLRPGGISLEQIRQCPGWEHTTIGYKNNAEKDTQPRAPGMKYRHYSPKALVVLSSKGSEPPSLRVMSSYAAQTSRIGLIRTQNWLLEDAMLSTTADATMESPTPGTAFSNGDTVLGFARMLKHVQLEEQTRQVSQHTIHVDGQPFTVYDISLGSNVAIVARGIFGALRDLDLRNVDAIFVEGVDESSDDLAAAVMNRLRKAAEVTL